MREYKSSIKTRPFLYREIKKAADFFSTGRSIEEIEKTAISDNLYQYNTEARRQEVAATISERLRALDNHLIKRISQGNLDTSKQIALFSILKTDRLFYEFMMEVFQEKCLLGELHISDKDFRIFFKRKAEQSQQVAAWADYTHYKLQQVIKRVLVEAGLAKKQKDGISLSLPMLDRGVIEHIKSNGDEKFLKAMLGEIK